MLSNEKSQFNDKEIIEKGSRALIRELGYSGFLRYIRQVETIDDEDYIKIQDSIYKDIGLEELYLTAKKNWENK